MHHLPCTIANSPPCACAPAGLQPQAPPRAARTLHRFLLPAPRGPALCLPAARLLLLVARAAPPPLSSPPSTTHLPPMPPQVAFEDGKAIIKAIGSEAGILTPDIKIGDDGERALLRRWRALACWPGHGWLSRSSHCLPHRPLCCRSSRMRLPRSGRPHHRHRAAAHAAAHRRARPRARPRGRPRPRACPHQHHARHLRLGGGCRQGGGPRQPAGRTGGKRGPPRRDAAGPGCRCLLLAREICPGMVRQPLAVWPHQVCLQLVCWPGPPPLLAAGF